MSLEVVLIGGWMVTMLNIVVWRVAFISVFACWSFIANAAVLEGWVVAVSDGDTVTVLDADHQQYKIRLMGIDAPEKAQAFGQKSKLHLSELIYRREVQIEWHKRDRYQRIIGKILVAPSDCHTCGMSVDAGLEQIRAGLAWWYRQYAKEQDPVDSRSYESAEEEAKRKRLGLWRDSEPIAPWEFRHKR